MVENSKEDRRHLFRSAVLGLLNGYFVLHPAAMVIFRLLEGTHHQHQGGSFAQFVWQPFAHSFQLSMLPMGVAFGLLGAAVGLVYGYQSRTIRRQRDSLHRQLARNEALAQELRHTADQLRERNDRLIELERMRRRMTHFLVHDFKASLNCIEGFAGLLLEDEEAAAKTENRDALDRIRRQARSMLGSVNNLLDIARLEGAPTLRAEPIRPSDLLAAVVDDVPFAGRDCHILIDEGSRSCPAVTAESGLIERVLLNLVSNALKHNRPGVQVSLSAAPTPNGREVVFACRDNGVGLPPERTATIFEPFQTGDHAPAESTGLGLAFARSAVEAHGGRIWCESSPGQGASVYFTLPSDRSAKMTDQPQETPKRVLVVEDLADFAALMESMLRGLGYDVAIACDGEEALSQAQACPPDLITLDIQMPRKSGPLFYRQLKSLEALRNIPVIVVTGLTRDDPEWDGIIHSLLEVEHLPQPEAYLDKPVDRDTLASVIDEALAGRQAV